MKISTESLARASAIHPWRTILIWTVVLALSAVTVYALLGDGLTTEFTHSNNPDSKKADTMLEDRLRGPRRVKEVVIVASEDLVVEDAAFEVKVTELFEEIDALGSDVIQSGINYYMLPAPDLVSDDRHTTIMPLILAGSFDEAMKNVEQLNDVVADANGEGGFKVIIAAAPAIKLSISFISPSL